MSYDYQTLEFYNFLDILKESFISYYAKLDIDKLSPYENADDILLEQSKYSEIINLVSDEIMLNKDEDSYHAIDRLINKEVSYDPKDLIIFANFLSDIAIMKSKLLSTKRIVYLKDLVVSINTLDDISLTIKTAIDDMGQIKDNATEELYAIRCDIKTYRDSLQKKLKQIINSSNASKFINEDTITVHNGRYTLSCKSNYHQYIVGIIQDKSTSGQTLYIEPSTAIPFNNAIQELAIKESEEIAKIIYNIISLFKASITDINLLIEKYSKLALYLDVGRFYKDKTIAFAEHSDGLNFKNLHHPLILLKQDNTSIGIDFSFGQDKQLAVITGPNTGGKTAALKSVGLNLILTYCGLPIFAESAKYVIYHNILADIGDKQSIVMDLSTFSSHMLNIKSIMEKSVDRSLLLFDELGTGTDAREGAALAIAILKYLLNRNSDIVVTTHFTEIKNFALNNSISMFYSVDFDYETFEPRYRLLKDIIGRSDPILIAKRLGFNEEVIELALEEVNQYKSSLEVSVDEINRMKAENTHLKITLDEWNDELNEREKKLTETDDIINKKLGKKEFELLSETYQLLQQSRRMVKDKKEKVDQESVESNIKYVESRLSKVKESFDKVKDIEVGDLIYLDTYNAKASVLSIRKDMVQVDINGFKLNLKMNDLIGKKIDKKQPAKKVVKIKDNSVTNHVKGEIVLVGMRVEEALDILETYLDKAIDSNVDTVNVVHGRGTGQLRKAVHEYLRKSTTIKSYRLAENQEGGQAITIVEL